MCSSRARADGAVHPQKSHVSPGRATLRDPPLRHPQLGNEAFGRSPGSAGEFLPVRVHVGGRISSPTVSVLVRLPFPVALAILAVGTGAGVAVSVRTGTFLWLVVALAGVAAFGALYMAEYSRLPGPEDELAAPKPSRKKAEMFADESEPPAPTERVPTPAAVTGPVEVDAFDPEYDPVAEADELETRSTGTAPAPSDP